MNNEREMMFKNLIENWCEFREYPNDFSVSKDGKIAFATFEYNGYGCELFVDIYASYEEIFETFPPYEIKEALIEDEESIEAYFEDDEIELLKEYFGLVEKTEQDC